MFFSLVSQKPFVYIHKMIPSLAEAKRSTSLNSHKHAYDLNKLKELVILIEAKLYIVEA